MICTSWSWPNMFDVSRNKINLYQDAKSITNRVKLLLLTEPTELYMSPNFGVGLKKYVFRYNNENTPAMIRDELIEQLRLWEPAVIAEQTKVELGTTQSRNEWSDPETYISQLNSLELTVTLTTSTGEQVSFDVIDSDIHQLI